MTGRIRARERAGVAPGGAGPFGMRGPARPYDAAMTPRKDNIHLFEKILAFNIYLWYCITVCERSAVMARTGRAQKMKNT